MTTLQNTIRPVELSDGLALARAQFKVDRTIMPSSMPYIRLRPNTSASQPNSNCPTIIPALVEAFRAWFTEFGRWPLFPPKPYVACSGVPDQNTTYDPFPVSVGVYQ